jgi:hypothetical protein
VRNEKTIHCFGGDIGVTTETTQEKNAEEVVVNEARFELVGAHPRLF